MRYKWTIGPDPVSAPEDQRATLLLSLWARDSVAVALIGSGIGSAMHALAHDIDHAYGGDIGQTVFFWIFAAALLVAGAARHARGSAAP